MSAKLNVTLLHGITPPTGTVVNNVDRTDSRPVKTFPSQAGISQPFQTKLITTTIMVKGKGYPSFAAVLSASTDTMTTGTAYLTGLTVEEGAEEMPDFTEEHVIYTNAA